MNDQVVYGNWAWDCPRCQTRFFVPVHVSPQPYYPGQEPKRPDFESQKFMCCGQTHEITSSNVKWVRVEDYPPNKARVG
jgi:hypothetical protein